MAASCHFNNKSSPLVVISYSIPSPSETLLAVHFWHATVFYFEVMMAILDFGLYTFYVSFQILVQAGACATCGCVCKRSWPLLTLTFLAQAACVRHACLRAPCVAWPLLLPLFSLSLLFFFLRLLLLTHFGETPVCEIISTPIFWHN